VERKTLTLDMKYAGSRKNRTIGRCETKTCHCASVIPRSSTVTSPKLYRPIVETLSQTRQLICIRDHQRSHHTLNVSLLYLVKCLVPFRLTVTSGLCVSHVCIFLHRRNRYGSTGADDVRAENNMFDLMDSLLFDVNRFI